VAIVEDREEDRKKRATSCVQCARVGTRGSQRTTAPDGKSRILTEKAVILQASLRVHACSRKFASVALNETCSRQISGLRRVPMLGICVKKLDPQMRVELAYARIRLLPATLGCMRLVRFNPPQAT
jgi:hypothetical protein